MDVEILICAPFNLLIEYPDENEDLFVENPNFSSIKSLLQIDIDTITWANECYDILGGKRELQSIKLFYAKDGQNYILLNNYFDPYDQLDTVDIGIKGKPEVADELRVLSRRLFDDCKYKIAYQEGNGQVFSQYPIDEFSRKRYLSVPENKYLEGKKVEIFTSA